MRLICNNIVSVITICILTVLMCSTGCRSQGSLPKLADLAWWKKDDMGLASTPPPPASHFSPEPTVEMLANNAVENTKSLGTGMTSDATSRDNSVNSTANANQIVGSAGVGPPIRKPYGYEGDSNSKVSNDNAFGASAGSIKTSLPDWNPTAKAGSSNISQVQRGLAESLESGQDSKGIANSQITQSPSKSPSDDSGDFANGWRNDFALPSKTNVANGGSNEFQQNAAKSASGALQPVVQESGDLQDDASQTVSQFAGSMGSPLPSRVAQAQPLYPQLKENELPDNSLRAANQNVPLPGTRAYQSTPFGKYSTGNKTVQIGQTLPVSSPNNSTQASFNLFEPNKVRAPSSAGPNSFEAIQATGGSTVPASIMHGSGSFAPGSVSPLIPSSK